MCDESTYSVVTKYDKEMYDNKLQFKNCLKLGYLCYILQKILNLLTICNTCIKFNHLQKGKKQ